MRGDGGGLRLHDAHHEPRGQRTSKRLIRPADVPAELRGATHGVRWEVRAGGATVYATACTAVTLD